MPLPEAGYIGMVQENTQAEKIDLPVCFFICAECQPIFLAASGDTAMEKCPPLYPSCGESCCVFAFVEIFLKYGIIKPISTAVKVQLLVKEQGYDGSFRASGARECVPFL